MMLLLMLKTSGGEWLKTRMMKVTADGERVGVNASVGVRQKVVVTRKEDNKAWKRENPGQESCINHMQRRAVELGGICQGKARVEASDGRDPVL